MEMKIYNLIATSDLYKQPYSVRAVNLQEASKQVKVKFAKQFHVFGSNVKISLDPGDLKNHIDEIMTVLYENK